MRPSEYIRRNVYFVAEPAERTIANQLELVGSDRIMWGSDFPHVDSTMAAPELIHRSIADLDADDRRRVLGGNAAAVFGLDAPAATRRPVTTSILPPRPDQEPTMTTNDTTTNPATIEGLEFDPDELRAKYLAERDKRLRPEGEAQYLETTGEYAHYANVDPMAPEKAPREAITGEVDVVIIGGGFSGMLMAARLLERGINDVRIIESGADFGGTWYWNRYPGAQCDIESYCYLPLLEETGYMPKEKYSFAPEIFEHSQRIGNQYGLYDLALFQTRVTDLSWSDDLNRWIVNTDRGDAIKARFTITATGPASKPKLAGIPGIHDFKGHSFHTSRWDYDYTGGSHAGGLDKLADKRVAIIGTGATAIQCVPHVGASAQAALRLPADPVLGRPPRQQAHRPRMGQVAADRVAARAPPELQRHRHRGAVRRGPRQRRVDRDLP